MITPLKGLFSIILKPSTPSLSQLRIPTGRRQTSWLFTKRGEFALVSPRTNPFGSLRRRFEPGLEYSNPQLWPLRHVIEKNCDKPPQGFAKRWIFHFRDPSPFKKLSNLLGQLWLIFLTSAQYTNIHLMRTWRSAPAFYGLLTIKRGGGCRN